MLQSDVIYLQSFPVGLITAPSTTVPRDSQCLAVTHTHTPTYAIATVREVDFLRNSELSIHLASCTVYA